MAEASGGRSLKKILACAILLSVAAGLAYRYSDSLFVFREAPLAHGSTRLGVVLYDRVRAQDGYYNIFTDYMDGRKCEVIDMEGRSVFTFPGAFCHFFKDGSIAFMTDRLSVFDPSGKLQWSEPDSYHHELDVTPDESEIFSITWRVKSFAGRKIHDDVIVGFTRDGKRSFTWSYAEHAKDFENLLGRPAESFHEPHHDFDSEDISHLNSVQVLQANPWAAKNPAFKPGNLLVNCFDNRYAFILERESGKVVWLHEFKGNGSSYYGSFHGGGTHSVKMLEDGNLFFFDNKSYYRYADTKFSSIVEMNPLTGQVIWRYLANPASQFLSPIWGSAVKLANGNVLITNSTAGSVFEVTRSGRVVWEWINPVRDDFGLAKPLYRVTRAPKSLIDRAIKVWR